MSGAHDAYAKKYTINNVMLSAFIGEARWWVPNMYMSKRGENDMLSCTLSALSDRIEMPKISEGDTSDVTISLFHISCYGDDIGIYSSDNFLHKTPSATGKIWSIPVRRDVVRDDFFYKAMQSISLVGITAAYDQRISDDYILQRDHLWKCDFKQINLAMACIMNYFM